MKRIAAVLFFLVWCASWVVLFRSDALGGAPERIRFLGGEIVTAVVVGAGLLLARRIRPVDAASLPIRQPSLELAIALGYLVAMLAGARALGLRTHIAAVGLNHATEHVWHQQTPRSVILWAAYFFVAGVVVPLIVLRWRGYDSATNLLKFPRGGRWIVYCLIAGAISIGGFVSPRYLSLPIEAHALAIVIFSLGTFLPVMVLIQAVIVPRLALVTRSTLTAAILGGLVYGVYHSGEFFMDWTRDTWLLSAAWLMQFAFFGVLKALTTLHTRSAWIHIFSTHLPHLAEAPALADVFGMDG